MSLNYQKEFTETEAVSIADTIAKLAGDDYEVSISLGGREAGLDFYPYVVHVVDTDGSIAAIGRDCKLVDALSEAYADTPEGKNR